MSELEETSKFEYVFNWLKTCPPLAGLWAISAEIQEWTDVLFLNNTAPLYSEITIKYIDGKTRVTLIPTADYNETYTINIYRPFAENANEFNIDVFNKTQQVCDWMIKKQNNAELFEIGGKPVYAVELLTPSPIMRGVDADNSLTGSYISIRVHMPNPAKRVDYFV